MFILQISTPPLQFSNLSNSKKLSKFNPLLARPHLQAKQSLLIAKLKSGNESIKGSDLLSQIEVVVDDPNLEEEVDEFSPRGRFRLGQEEMDYDRNPEFAEIIGSCLDDPQKARSKVSPVYVCVCVLLCVEALLH